MNNTSTNAECLRERELMLNKSTGADATSPDVANAQWRRANNAPLRSLTLAELLEYPFPQPEPILAPWLVTQSLCMIHAWRGVGKTHVALNIAVAVATAGSFLRWNAPIARNVLYVDGEMPGSALQSRVRAILDAKNVHPSMCDHLRFITPDALQMPMPDLVGKAGQQAIEELAGDVDLIVLDNISTLFRTNGPENEAESWRAPQEWALRMRQRGKAILFVHHSGKGGAQRGSSKREDTLDVVIHLRNPGDYSADQGARFEIHFEKFRQGRGGDDAAALEATLTQGPSGGAVWTWEPVRSDLTEEIVRLAVEGKPQRDIAKVLGTSASTVNRILAKERALNAEPGQARDSMN